MKTAPSWGGTRGIVLLSSQVWKDVNGWALEIGIACTYSNPVVTGGQKHTHTFHVLQHFWLKCNFGAVILGDVLEDLDREARSNLATIDFDDRWGASLLKHIINDAQQLFFRI